jgi:hypothetical protein
VATVVSCVTCFSNGEAGFPVGTGHLYLTLHCRYITDNFSDRRGGLGYCVSIYDNLREDNFHIRPEDDEWIISGSGKNKTKGGNCCGEEGFF